MEKLFAKEVISKDYDYNFEALGSLASLASQLSIIANFDIYYEGFSKPVGIRVNGKFDYDDFLCELIEEEAGAGISVYQSDKIRKVEVSYCPGI